ncbi:hypothetical protein EIO_2030 [Ketogulonicigenium vulgare Y25]|uniref:Uncharacterized protein n=2 Tax=Ketogulonicigenium vulgare TaxID=92945 RepID=F9YA26_KETVW|nr:hypothetical protein [Ketogulonicigenium vulgare]ADO43139.1 hypothetical protein EIO_2030 [Ketogulonicigenium vulgare Y25]AEM41437.1 hypothetical protein KVU_1598 [Ketogulonicigenium vulgare WSH-001]ALJ81570.1 hypothetical protein KVH_10525 [Ketogulonicigenium vulgare]ANW34257.1 hypothetical protein KvSKV_10450 [Ketogulonicigenium vulgare]AOZ55176.1 hypothetical protein KVC_2169 [Ketogulonicigenium vulgare]
MSAAMIHELESLIARSKRLGTWSHTASSVYGSEMTKPHALILAAPVELPHYDQAPPFAVAIAGSLVAQPDQLLSEIADQLNAVPVIAQYCLDLLREKESGR